MEFKLLKGMLPKYDEVVNYHLELGEDLISINDLIGKNIKITYNGSKRCISCGRDIKKNTYNQGYCYPCFRDLAENDLCIAKPHLCHFYEGTCRDEEFAKNHCFTSHIVYLAISSSVKVGITRKVTLQKRWMDQGAIEAIPIAQVPDRRTAGLIEESLMEYLNDKTDWRKMLKGESTGDLDKSLRLVREVIRDDFRDYLVEGEVLRLNYPHHMPQKLKSIDLEKNPLLESKLLGIKGQYLILEDGVLNIRKHRGFHCVIEFN